MHRDNCFLTLTYDDKHCPNSLEYRDFQRFMYRLRSRLGPTRFFACGEYGELTRRPHFHAILFGRSFPGPIRVGTQLYTSKVLEELWPFGFASFGHVTYQSAAYVGGYALKKVSGPAAESHYTGVDWRTGELVPLTPEFARMSLKPGIGYTWFQKYWREVYVTRDAVVLQGGKHIPPPRYYDTLLERLDFDLHDHKTLERYTRSLEFSDDNTPARLAVREHVARARVKQKEKTL